VRGGHVLEDVLKFMMRNWIDILYIIFLNIYCILFLDILKLSVISHFHRKKAHFFDLLYAQDLIARCPKLG
jgi:hypothetical protein